MKREWTKIDEMIKDMMLRYPGIFPSRLDCLRHLLTLTGTGYYWNEDGDRVNEIGPVNPEPITSIKLEKECLLDVEALKMSKCQI